MISHFVKAGAYTLRTSTFDGAVSPLAIENPSGEIVLVIRSALTAGAKIALDGLIADIKLDTGAIYTVVIER